MTDVQEKATPAEVRQWAKDNGHEVAAKGRLSVEVREAFTAATGRAA
jgi:Lsr2